MVTMVSNTQSEQEISEAMTQAGLTPIVKAPKEPEAKVEDKTEPAAEPVGEPGEEIPAEPGDETKPALEAGKTETQESSQVTEPPKPKAKGGWQAKLEKKTRELDSIREELEQERGDKTKLREQIAELESQIAELKPAEPAKPEQPVRPKRPSLAEFDFDQDKYEAAMAEYDTQVEAYLRKVTEANVAKALADADERRKQEAAVEATQAELRAFEQRRDESKAVYEDFDDVLAGIPKSAVTALDSDVVRGYVAGKSKQPALLMYFFAQDYLENGGAESERILALDPYDQIIEIKEIEKQIEAQLKAGKSEVKPEAKAEPEKKTPPARVTPPAKTPDSPITPVGGRVAGSNTGATDFHKLAETNPKEFRNRLMSKLPTSH